MKKLLLFAVCVMTILTGCNKQAKEKPFVLSECDSITVKDGADNLVRLPIPITFSMDSVYSDLFQSEKELNNFFTNLVWNLKNQCKNPRTFKPLRIWTLNFVDTIEYNGENIYVLSSLVDGVASNAYGVEGDVSQILDLIAWKEITHFEANEETGEPAEDLVYWHIMENDKYFLDYFKKEIDKKQNK